MINILDQINNNEITIDKAYDIFDEVVESRHKGLIKLEN